MSTEDQISYRRGTLEDMRAVQRLFRISLYELLHRVGVIDTARPSEEEIESNWNERREVYEFLAHNAHQFWVAERAGEILGYARTIRSGAVHELTEFFVLPTAQSAGLGRELLGRAFPAEAGTQRCIIATGDARAQARYLKAGTRSRCVIYEFYRQPEAQPLDPRLEIEPLAADEATLARLAEIDEAVLGYRRDAQHRWLIGSRPGSLYRVAGEIVGYGYVGAESGPFALRDPQWTAAVLAHAETQSAEQGRERFALVMPALNSAAIQHCLGRGFLLDPFLMYLMADAEFGHFDRYIITDPALVL